MAMNFDEYSGLGVLSATTDITGDEVPTARRAVQDLLEQRPALAGIAIDLERVELFDSAGLEWLLWARRKCDEQFGAVRLAGITPTARTILEATRLVHRFEIAPDVGSALKAMR